MDIRYISYLSFCHAIPKLRSYCDQKLKLSLKFSYKYWTHCKTLSKTIQSLYFSLIFIFQSLKLEFERLSIFQKFSESFTKYLIHTFIHFNWPVMCLQVFRPGKWFSIRLTSGIFFGCMNCPDMNIQILFSFKSFCTDVSGYSILSIMNSCKMSLDILLRFENLFTNFTSNSIFFVTSFKYLLPKK